MKKLVAAALFVAACSFGASARASCAAAGQYYSGHLTLGNITIDGAGWGTVFGTAGPAQMCDDGNAPGLGSPHVSLTIRQEGAVVCSLTNADGLTFGFDPFVFGGGFHAHGGTCGADVTFDALGGPGIPDPALGDAGSDGTTAFAGVGRTAQSSGTYWLDGEEPIEIPSLTPSHWTMGAKAGAI